MKKALPYIIIACFVFILTCTIKAEETSIDRVKALEICKVTSEFAEKIMTLRQDGYDIAKVMNSIPNSKIGAILSNIVLEAYKIPVMSLQENKLKIILEFKNKVYTDFMIVFLGPK